FRNLSLVISRLIDDVESKCIAMFDGALVPDFGKSQTQAELQVFAKRNPVVRVILLPQDRAFAPSRCHRSMIHRLMRSCVSPTLELSSELVISWFVFRRCGGFQPTTFRLYALTKFVSCVSRPSSIFIL